MYNYEEIEEYVKETLSEKRYIHSVNVMERCIDFAKTYNVDTEKARRVGILHDVAKELSKEEKLEYALKNNLKVDNVEKSSPGLLHGKIAADIGKRKYDYTEDMQEAIAYHTTGCENMNILTKILFVADACSIDRTYHDVEKIYNLAKKDINLAVLECLNYAITENIEKGKLLHPNSIYARNYLLIEKKG